jgi:hypothetical protein
MHRWMSTALAGALALCATPGEAAWKSYISRELGFSFRAPGEIKTETGTYQAPVAGEHPTIVYSFADDGIEYRVTVMTFQAPLESASVLGEREFLFQDGKKVLTDSFGRVENGKEAVYGRKIVIELPGNKGRTTGAFYFAKGRMVSLEATVLPANGDYGSPDPALFVDSIAFILNRTEPGAVELAIPKPK